MPTGWTYRQILETVTFKPRGEPHLWDARIAQLAANLGMPSGTTPGEVVTFVLHVAKAKNELNQVMPLVRALAGASRRVHGQSVVPVELRPLAAQLYPDAARMLGFPEYIGIREVDLNTAVQGHSVEVSHHVCSSYSPMRMLMVPVSDLTCVRQRSTTIRFSGQSGRDQRRTSERSQARTSTKGRRGGPLLPRRLLLAVIRGLTRVCEAP